MMVAKKDVHMPYHPELADKNVPKKNWIAVYELLLRRG